MRPLYHEWEFALAIAAIILHAANSVQGDQGLFPKGELRGELS